MTLTCDLYEGRNNSNGYFNYYSSFNFLRHVSIRRQISAKIHFIFTNQPIQ